MKTLLLTMALAGVLLPLAGCESVADTPSENSVRVKHAMLLDLKQLPDDVDYVLYVDRPMWLSKYPIPND